MIALLIATSCCVAEQQQYDPTSSYDVRVVEGWTVYVNPALDEEPDDLGKRTMRELEFQLYQVTRAMPAPALAKLREVPIWVEAKSSVTCMCYHPSAAWLRTNGFNPAKEKAIELGNPKNFLNWTRHQFWMVFHELAHAYHDRVFGWDRPDDPVRAAYEQAKEKKLYDKVLVFNGNNGKAYAMNNHKEYFAELSEAYFGCNDWYPFVKAELKKLDPAGYAALEEAWGVVGKPTKQPAKEGATDE